MKRLFSAIVLLALAFSLGGTAFARTGFDEPEKKTNEGFSLTAQLYEGRESGVGLDLGSFLNGGDAQPLTGRIVIATDVVYLVTMTVPKLSDTTLLDKDYEKARIKIECANLDIKKIYYPKEGTPLTNMAEGGQVNIGGKLFFSAVQIDKDDLEEGIDEAFTINLAPDALKDARESKEKLEYTFAIAGQTMRTAHVNIKSTFNMGQDVREAPYSVFFVRNNNRFMARLKDGEFSVEFVTPSYKSLASTDNGLRSRIAFTVGGEGKLSDMRFVYGPTKSAVPDEQDDGTPGDGTVDMIKRDGDRVDWVWSISKCSACGSIKFTSTVASTDCPQGSFCACNTVASERTFFSNARTTLNRLLVSVGFTYNLSNVEYGYVSANRINRLSGVTDLSRTVTSEIEACTEPSEMVLVDIPQTGSMALGGVILAFSAAAAVLRKRRG